MSKYDALIVGYYGMKNSGDDMLFYATIKGAHEELGLNKFAVSSASELYHNNQYDVSLVLPEKQLFRGHNRLNLYTAALMSKHIFFGGGSVLHSYRDIQIKRHLMKLASSNEHAALGVSIGPFRSSQTERECAKFLNECTLTGVRDSDSLDIAKSIAPNAAVVPTFDLALSQLSHKLEKFNVPFQRRIIGVCLCPTDELQHGQDLKTRRIQTIIDSLKRIPKSNYDEIWLIDFNGHPNLGDYPIHLPIYTALKRHTNVRHFHYDSNPWHVVSLIRQCSVTICMRLHASIFSYMTGTPAINICYHKKCWEWSRSIEMDQRFIFPSNDFSANDLLNRLEQVLNGDYPEPSLTVKTANQYSMKNWRLHHEYNIPVGSHSPL
ncbi:MAG: polysaccharide pyruvyl transferase family protein [Pseudomonadales bacterium]